MATSPVHAEQRWSSAFKLVLAVVAMIAAIASTSNWCFVGLAAAVAGPVVDVLVDEIGLTSRLGKAASFGIRLAIAAVVGVAVGWLLQATPEWAFREAMGNDPPAGVQVTRVQRHYEGGPGEHTLIVEFTADASVMNSLITDKVVEESAKSERIAAWRAAGGTWEEALRHLGRTDTLPFAWMTWKRIRPLENPQVYDFGIVNHGYLILLYDTTSERAVVLHRRL